MFSKRLFWIKLIENSWTERSIIWLMGVRRIGKTTLAHSLADVLYFDCERPKIRALFSDPEEFLEANKGKRIILDEIHRLDNPSELLKIAADHFPETKILATGSSTLGASAKFRDTLTGRKREVWLTPLLLHEMKDFGDADISKRFLHGGFPENFSRENLIETDFSEWVSSYWAKDIQEMFKVQKRDSFIKFFQLLLAESGCQFDASRFAAYCEISRPAVLNYLSILEETFVVHVLKPFSTRKSVEIVSTPKVYGFDTGFVCWARGWTDLRPEDKGLLWEHVVLNELQGNLQTRQLSYWRDKRGHEIDFVIKSGRQDFVAIECKFNSTKSVFSPEFLKNLDRNFSAFRHHYPDGQNFIVSHDVEISFKKTLGDVTVEFVNPEQLIQSLTKKGLTLNN